MPVILTYVAIVVLLAAVLALRLAWPRLSPGHRRVIAAALALLLLPALASAISRWTPANPHLNAGLLWIRLLAGALFLAAFSLLRPRALTSAVAVILAPFLFSSSIVGPASSLFSTASPSIRPVSDGYFLELLPWSSGPGGNGGADFSLFYQPPGLSLLRRPFMGARLYNSQCRTADTTATVDPRTAHITVHCPPLSTDPAAPPSGTELDYIIPSGARSPSLARSMTR